MEVEQTINITEIEVTDSGILNCSIIIDGVECTSEPFDLQVAGIYITCMWDSWISKYILTTFTVLMNTDFDLVIAWAPINEFVF